ncbi:related to regulatory protein alcR [Moesziomyces antarcticus]|nr:related to regulatory protein alcR [Moesziomyces antarcticus]
MKAESSTAIAAITMSSLSAKDSRRRQYRSCDRCRTGKRACNAVYDSVAEAINSKVACSNCRKKGKTCSFQYVLSILGGVPSTATHQELPSLKQSDPSDDADTLPHVAATLTTLAQPSASPFGLDVQQQTAPSIGSIHAVSPQSTLTLSQRHQSHPMPHGLPLTQAMAFAAAAYRASATISPTSSAHRMTTAIDRIFLNDGLIRVYEGAAEQALRCWITSANTPYMLLDRTSSSPLPSALSSSAGQQLVYWRICELDRGARGLLGHSSAALSREKDIMDAFHSVVLAFAAQWSPHWISGLAGKANLHAAGPQLSKASENKVRLALWECARDKLQKVANLDSFRVIFALIIFAWTEKPREVLDRAANDPDIDLNSDNCALDTSSWQSPAEGSTFLLVAAMRKLLSIKFKIEGKKRRGLSPWNAPGSKTKPSASASSSADQATSLNHVGASSGPNAHNGTDFEPSEKQKMARQIQSDLESRRQSTEDNTPHTAGTAKASPNEVARMEGTYHMLYWLCVVIDTETSVLRKHPPVVCDEDSEVMSSVPGAAFSPDAFDTASCELPTPAAGRKGIWDDYIIDISKRKAATEFASSWPCDEKKAAATLAFSTPVKVVMFRQISRLQMSFWRRASTQAVEQHIRSGLSIIYHWNQIYGRLIDSCRESHASLPASIQSWYTLLAFPWYLAVLLFVEMVQTVDMAGSSDKHARFERARSGIFPRLRDRACSDLALLIGAIQSTAFNHQEPTFQYVRDSGGNLLLTEPWSEILVHSITTVVKTEVKLHEGYCSLFKWKELEESHARIEKCLWALEQLSDRSPSAHMAHEQLEKLTNARRQGNLAFPQIPMASPPLAREMRPVWPTEGPSPGSDADSNRASGFGGSVEGSEVSPMGFDSVQAEGSSLESALHSYFTANLGLAHQPSVEQHCVEQQEAPIGVAPSQTDYLQLLQMIGQNGAANGSAGIAAADSLVESLTTSAGGELSIDPLAILETLAQLTNQPVRELRPLGSDASSSSVETVFSLDATEWDLGFGPAASAGLSAGDAFVRPGMHAAPSYATQSTSVTSCSDSEEEGSLSGPAKKKCKTASPSSVPLQAQLRTQGVQSSPSIGVNHSLGQKFMSMPLQAAAPREHDDLYGDEDDDELISYRNGLKRKREHVDGDRNSSSKGELMNEAPTVAAS